MLDQGARAMLKQAGAVATGAMVKVPALVGRKCLHTADSAKIARHFRPASADEQSMPSAGPFSFQFDTSRPAYGVEAWSDFGWMASIML